METFIKLFVSNLEKWIETQQNFLASIEKIEGELSEADRLDLILATRTAFKHIIKTIEAFDKWLQDPFIVGHMPREMLQEVQKETWDILKKILELDIKHTSEFRTHVLKLASENRLNPVLYQRRREREDRLSMSV